MQRPENEALAVVAQFHLWLLTAALLFTIGGLLFWLLGLTAQNLIGQIVTAVVGAIVALYIAAKLKSRAA